MIKSKDHKLHLKVIKRACSVRENILLIRRLLKRIRTIAVGKNPARKASLTRMSPPRRYRLEVLE
jgi:hypothetical protein